MLPPTRRGCRNDTQRHRPGLIDRLGLGDRLRRKGLTDRDLARGYGLRGRTGLRPLLGEFYRTQTKKTINVFNLILFYFNKLMVILTSKIYGTAKKWEKKNQNWLSVNKTWYCLAQWTICFNFQIYYFPHNYLKIMSECVTETERHTEREIEREREREREGGGRGGGERESEVRSLVCQCYQYNYFSLVNYCLGIQKCIFSLVIHKWKSKIYLK